MQSNEEWKAVCGWEGMYEVSNLGRVRSLLRMVRGPNGLRCIDGTLRTPFVTRWGYAMIDLAYCGKKTKMLVHRLVATAFVGERPPHLDVHHKNGCKLDNRADNLAYVTRSDNLRHAYRTGLRTIAPNQKLIADQVREIRALYAAGGQTQQALADAFKCSRENISAITRRSSWRERA